MARPIATVGALIVADGKILLIKSGKWSGKFTLPGGKVEEGESLREAVEREVMEELGMKVKAEKIVSVGEYLKEGNYHKPAHLIFINILCRPLSEATKRNEEVDEVRWFPLKEAETSEEVDVHTRKAVSNHLRGACGIDVEKL